jgi:hypothetical protein
LAGLKRIIEEVGGLLGLPCTRVLHFTFFTGAPFSFTRNQRIISWLSFPYFQYSIVLSSAVLLPRSSIAGV